jgi:hypothetical protein
MYTRAKEIAGKVMAGGENNIDVACSRPKLLIRVMEVIIFIETIPVTPSYSNALDKGFSTAVMIQVQQNSIIE